MCKNKVSWLDAMLFKGATSKLNIMNDFQPKCFIHIYTFQTGYRLCLCMCMSVCIFFYNTKKLKTITILHKTPKGKYHLMHLRNRFCYSFPYLNFVSIFTLGMIYFIFSFHFKKFDFLL